MTATTDAISWLKATFGSKIDKAIKGTPFSRDLVVAIAMQETSYIWIPHYKKKSADEILALCVGDTIDKPSRKAFPRDRADLESAPDGKKMFEIARASLELIATIDKSYAKVAKNKNKFCHGFGMFQYDIQFFKKVDPDWFLKRRWTTFDGTVGKCVSELQDKLKVVYGAKKKSLDHDESVYVAIAYNKGSANTKKGFKQGFRNSEGKYYGEMIDRFLTLAEKTP